MPKLQQITLPNGCYCSQLSVFPKNWKSSVKSMETDWYISYRFYDPTNRDGAGKIKPHQRIVKGMNESKTWTDRKKDTILLMEDELNLLRQGYNPILKKFTAPQLQAEISPDTPFLDALRFAKSKLKHGPSVQTNLKSILTYVEKATYQLSYHKLFIGEIKRKHLKLVLEQIEKNNPKWTANTFNHYRKHLSMLFNELLEYDAVEYNPVRELKKQKHVHRIREVLSDSEREKVKHHLDQVFPAFSRLTEIFFHSGVRETELLNVRAMDVDLEKERFKITLRKGGQPVEEWREIKKVALPLWQEAMVGATAKDYLFSEGFVPGEKKMSEGYITDQWYSWVKRKPRNGDKRKYHGIGITADFYALKHLHTTEVIDILEQLSDTPALEAARHNGHRSTDMVEKVYDVKSKGRKGKLVKLLPNTFIKQGKSE